MIKLKNRKRLLEELVKATEFPKEFIYSVMALQGQTAEDVVREVDITSAHFYVAMSQIASGHSIGIKVCAKIAQGLNIDPFVLNRLVADYNMNNYLNNGTDQNTQRETADQA